MSQTPRRPGGPSGNSPGGRSGGPGNRPPDTRPPGSRPPATRPPGDRPSGERGKPSGGNINGNKVSGGKADRADYPRPSGARLPSDRPPGRAAAPHSPSRASGPRPSSPRNADGELRQPPRTSRPVEPARSPSPRGGPSAAAQHPPGVRPDSRPRIGTERPRSAAERPHTERTLSVPPRADRPPFDRPASDRAPAERAYDERAPTRAHLPETPRGTVWLYGQHAIEAALSNPARRLRRLILTEEAEAALTARHPPPWPLSPERTERSRIDQLLGRDVVHQGAALLADPLPTPLLTKVLERPGVVLVLDQVVDPRNIGAVLRSAAAFGAACVITQDRNAPEETGALAKAASGALETVPLVRAVNLARTLVALKAAGFWTIGLDAGGAPLSGPALAERRVALVLGAEGAGLRRLVRETCDEVAGLAMPGAMESLNVSAAATVALYELSRRA